MRWYWLGGLLALAGCVVPPPAAVPTAQLRTTTVFDSQAQGVINELIATENVVANILPEELALLDELFNLARDRAPEVLAAVATLRDREVKLLKDPVTSTLLDDLELEVGFDLLEDRPLESSDLTLTLGLGKSLLALRLAERQAQAAQADVQQALGLVGAELLELRTEILDAYIDWRLDLAALAAAADAGPTALLRARLNLELSRQRLGQAALLTIEELDRLLPPVLG